MMSIWEKLVRLGRLDGCCRNPIPLLPYPRVYRECGFGALKAAVLIPFMMKRGDRSDHGPSSSKFLRFPILYRYLRIRKSI